MRSNLGRLAIVVLGVSLAACEPAAKPAPANEVVATDNAAEMAAPEANVVANNASEANVVANNASEAALPETEQGSTDHGSTDH